MPIYMIHSLSKDTANKSNERTIYSLYNGHWTTEWSFPWSIDKFWSIYFWFGLPNKKVIYEYSWLASEKAIKNKIPHIRLNFVKTLLCGLIIQSLCNGCLKLKSLIIMFNVFVCIWYVDMIFAINDIEKSMRFKWFTQIMQKIERNLPDESTQNYTQLIQ